VVQLTRPVVARQEKHMESSTRRQWFATNLGMAAAAVSVSERIRTRKVGTVHELRGGDDERAGPHSRAQHSPRSRSKNADRQTISQEDRQQLVDLLRHRPLQFCMFLRALLGQTNMELMMLSAIKNTRAMAADSEGRE